MCTQWYRAEGLAVVRPPALGLTYKSEPLLHDRRQKLRFRDTNDLLQVSKKAPLGSQCRSAQLLSTLLPPRDLASLPSPHADRPAELAPRLSGDLEIPCLLLDHAAHSHPQFVSLKASWSASFSSSPEPPELPSASGVTYILSPSPAWVLLITQQCFQLLVLAAL